jgi:predicted O-linked N-acetylglucosamine transferase (SPINDLY family)
VNTIPEALNFALQHHRAGRLHEAELIYRQILEIQPDHSDALHLLGLIAHHVGRHAPAAELIGRAVALNPTVPAYYNNLGEACRAQGKREEAIDCYRRAVELSSDFVEAYYNLGVVLQEQCKLGDAIEHFRKALAINSRYAAAFNGLGVTLALQGNDCEAIECLRQAVALHPEDAGSYNNLGGVLLGQGQLEEAEICLRRAVTLAPTFAEAYNNLGTVLKKEGKSQEAEEAYRQALAIKPEYAEAYNNLGSVLAEQGKLAEAENVYLRALTLKPDFTDVHANLGRALTMQGKLKEGVDHYQQALALHPSDGLRVLMATALPVIGESAAHLRATRRHFKDHVSVLLEQKLSLADPVTQVDATNFYLAYQGLNDCDLQQAVSRLYLQACPALNFVADHCRSLRALSPSRKVSIGFISRFFVNHSIGKLMRGIIAQLSRRQFTVTVFTFPGRQDATTGFLAKHADKTVVLPFQLDDARRHIAQEQVDVLFYADIGMDPLTYFLAFSRLAPVQCVTWGHPTTTGIPTMDYFISSTHLEPEDGNAHYSERLVRFKHPPTYYYQPEKPAPLKSQSDLGLDDSRTVYLCPQNLFKLHPDFDEVIADILKADSKGTAVFIEGHHPHWTDLFVGRLKTGHPEVAQRIRVLPRVLHEDFLRLLAAADVILDPLHWSGGNTTYEALALGVPVVTLPGKLMRGRVTFACYKQMGMMDCVAKTKKEYAALAVRLGTDAVFRERIKARILAKNHALFENIEIVREFERFFLKMVKDARSPVIAGSAATKQSRK